MLVLMPLASVRWQLSNNVENVLTSAHSSCNAKSHLGPGASLARQRELLKLLTYFRLPDHKLK